MVADPMEAVIIPNAGKATASGSAIAGTMEINSMSFKRRDQATNYDCTIATFVLIEKTIFCV